MKPKIVEIGVEVTPTDLCALLAFLSQRGIPFYKEPPRANPYNSLEELEADCEGK